MDMTKKTKSEDLFEKFLDENCISYERIKVAGQGRSMDYLLIINGYEVAFEIKEISKDENFKADLSSRTVGAHIRAKISKGKKQIQSVARNGVPAVLLIYNNLDPMHLFGTENHDFMAAMHGELTVRISKRSNKIIDMFHGHNKSFSKGKNTSFSAVGRLRPCQGRLEVTLFDNPWARVKLDYAKLPDCFEIQYVYIDN